MQYYDLHICGLTRRLPLAHISKKIRLANFSVLGDVELVDKLADALTEKVQPLAFDYLVALELKIVPLVHGVAKRLGQQRFIVCRKSVKPYMVAPIMLKPQAHFPKHVKSLVINGEDAALLKGKRVIIIDSVISTGVTIRMMKKLMEKIGATVMLMVAVLRQGEQFEMQDHLVFLGEIPIIQQ